MEKNILSIFIFIFGYLLGSVFGPSKVQEKNSEPITGIFEGPDELSIGSNILTPLTEKPIRSPSREVYIGPTVDYTKKLSDSNIPNTYNQDLNTVLEEAYQKDSIHAYYINRYADLAIKEHNLYRFPASVKLAQFLIEGGYKETAPQGSRLVTEGSNPFGIKYFGDNKPERISNWSDLAFPNQYVSAKDDCKSSCKFVKFRGIWHAFRYHSIFMVGTESMPSHYTKYVSTGDWKNWLNALEKGGYATSEEYRRLLYNVITDYKLYLLDKH